MTRPPKDSVLHCMLAAEAVGAFRRRIPHVKDFAPSWCALPRKRAVVSGPGPTLLRPAALCFRELRFAVGVPAGVTRSSSRAPGYLATYDPAFGLRL
jgi:hypothetical protein